MKKILLLVLFTFSLFGADIKLSKSEFTVGDPITITLSGMAGNEGDWVGVFPKNKPSVWENVVTWKFDGQVKDGTYDLDSVPVGEYEARVFLDNSYTLLAKIAFSVKERQGVTIALDKASYESNQQIKVTLGGMPANEGDWIGIFPKGKPSVWENILTWKFDGKVKDGENIIDGVPKGDYEVRVFLNNSYTILAKKEFSVIDAVYNTVVNTKKYKFFEGEPINITLSGMPGNEGDWVGIFKKGDPSIWKNTIAWKFDGHVGNGDHSLDTVPAGVYEVRVFLNNSMTVLDKAEFIVIKKPIITTVKTAKTAYNNGEQIVVSFTNMLGNQKDWIGIFPVGVASTFKNAYDWEWSDAVKAGDITFHGLPAGAYEVRAFFNNKLEVKATYNFSVKKVKLPDTILEDAENSLNPNWIQIIGKYPPKRATPGLLGSKGTLVLNPQWKQIHGDNWENGAEYQLPLNYSTHTILEMDIGGMPNYTLPTSNRKGYMPHFSIGVYVKTAKGWRALIWDSFFNHGKIPAHIEDYGNGNIWLNFPSPVEHVRGWYKPIDFMSHFRVDIEAALKQLEPDNKLIYLEDLYVTGGFLDNIKLLSK